MRIAQILYNKAHYIFEAKEIPILPPDQDGNPIVFVEISEDVQEGWHYDLKSKKFTKPEAIE